MGSNGVATSDIAPKPAAKAMTGGVADATNRKFVVVKEEKPLTFLYQDVSGG